MFLFYRLFSFLLDEVFLTSADRLNKLATRFYQPRRLPSPPPRLPPQRIPPKIPSRASSRPPSRSSSITLPIQDSQHHTTDRIRGAAHRLSLLALAKKFRDGESLPTEYTPFRRALLTSNVSAWQLTFNDAENEERDEEMGGAKESGQEDEDTGKHRRSEAWEKEVENNR